MAGLRNRFIASQAFITLLTIVPAIVGPTRVDAQTGTPTRPEPVRLVLGLPIRGQLAEGKIDSYSIELQTGQYMRAVYVQPQSSTVASLFPMQDKVASVELHLVGGQRGGYREPICWIAKEKGEYRLEIAASGKVSGSPDYQIQLDEIRPAAAADQYRLSVQGSLEEARLLTSRNEAKEALAAAERALSSARAAKDQDREAAALNAAASLRDRLSEEQEAAAYYEQAMSIERDLKDRSWEARSLNNLSIVYMRMNKPKEAVSSLKRALVIEREINDRQTEGKTLGNLAVAYHDLGQFEDAVRSSQEALQLQREIKDRRGEGRSLDTLGTEYSSLSRYADAIQAFEQSLAIKREINDRAGEANSLGNIGNTYLQLGQYQQAVGYFEQTLAIMRELKYRAGEGEALTSLGDAYRALHQPQKAIGIYTQAVEALREGKDQSGEATTLTALGDAYRDLKQEAQAIALYEQASAIVRKIQDRVGEGETLKALGHAYRELGQGHRAIEYYRQALAIDREIRGRRSEEFETLAGMMEAWQISGNPRLAIFYGKQAVNTIQSIRADINSLTPALQKSFLKGNEKPYHTLADLLIAQGRLAEAEQVLGLLKEQEYFDYVRRDAAEASSVHGNANLNPEEAEADKRYREIDGQLAAIGAERGDLLAKNSRTPEETQRLDRLEKDIAVGNTNFEKFLDDLAQRFAAKPAMALRVEDLRETQGIMEDLRELPPGTVAIFTLVGEDKFRAILRTSDVQKAYEYPIAAADLNRKISDFRQVAMDPERDPRPLAAELYKIVVGPMAEDLRQAKAQTLMWSLDGTLRYLPLAALYDGQRYLIEQYRVSVMTLASETRLKDRPDAEWKAAGFGVTKAYKDAPALPWVSAELSGIIASKPGDAGALAGEVELDDAFTQQAMKETLRKRYAVVHIASHFRFQPGDVTQSFLLLGDGRHLSLADLKTSANLFGGVQLLTLSACNTGMGDGTEVEGFGALAQRQGAKAVIASLWPVADASTSLLMQRFYRIRESSPGKTKLEALREAQLELLHGTAKLAESAATPRGVLVKAVNRTDGNPAMEAPRFAADPQVPYAHPYYWAPFFLMGNWL